MDDSVRIVSALLTKYWREPGVLDAKTRNYCRMLANTVFGSLTNIEVEQITQQPEDHSGELAIILDRLSRTDPNSSELIKALLASAKDHPSISQSVQVSGNNNQVITVGGNMIGDPIIQNSPAASPKRSAAPGNDHRTSQNHRQTAGDYENAVFISYAWGGESEQTVDELEQAFAKHGIRIVRDKKDLGYKGSIEMFERRIGQGQCIVLVISDKYLRSEHCMHELVEVDTNRSLRERIFPIVLADARIYKAMDRLTYIKYWDEQIEKLNQSIKEVGILTNLAGITADLDKYARIRSNFDHLIDLLRDMNALTPEIHTANGFSTLISAVERAMAGEE